MTKTVSASALKAMIRDGEELAILDVREDGQFGEGHMLHATPKPYSVLERGLSAIAPRKSVRAVLVDAGDGVAARAASRMGALGYTDVRVLDGGMDAWAAAGFEVFKGVNVPSKAFGEVVEVSAHTPSISADELAAMQEEGAPHVILDGRTPEEFQRMSIPGGVSVPNAELVYRIQDIAPDPDVTVVVNCAGRTRSIIGAQTLINAGVPNRVVALRGGTMGWRLAGRTLDNGKAPDMPSVSAAGVARAKDYAGGVALKFDVGSVDQETLAAWRRDAERTLFLLDVRSADEFAAGHLPGSVHAPGGQLVQTTDHWCGVRGARVVLVDDAAGVRATMTGHWLVQMGWEVHVLEGGVGDVGLEMGEGTVETLGLDMAAVPSVTASQLAEMTAKDEAAVADVDLSGDYRAGHIPGAVWGVRPRADRLLAAIGGADERKAIVLYSEHETRARLVAMDMAELTDRSIFILAGGRERWRAEGRPLEASPDTPTDADRIDFLFFVHDRHFGNDQAARDYLAWEEQLPDQIAADGDAGFKVIA